MTTEEIALVLIYWVNIFLWSGLVLIFVKKYFKAKLVEPAVKITIVALGIAFFSRWFADLYYGIMKTSEYGILPKVLNDVMSQPQFWVLPKIVTLLGGLALLWVVTKLLKLTVSLR